ncbi:MAG: hypothetical protein IJX26_04660 [Clostridia bacterium]|nr:hypothetical protein [Clostridia bacterium]
MMKKKINWLYLAMQLVLILGAIFFLIAHLVDLNSNEILKNSMDNFQSFLYCLLFSFLPLLMKLFKIKYTKTLQIYFLIAIMGHFIGGRVLMGYHTKLYSFIIHFVNSALIGFIIYGMFIRNSRNQSNLYLFLATLGGVALVGMVWELVEFSYDLIFDGNMQRFVHSTTGVPFVGQRALMDTMIDVCMDLLGGVVAGLFSNVIKIKGLPVYAYLELKSEIKRPALFGEAHYYLNETVNNESVNNNIDNKDSNNDLKLCDICLNEVSSEDRQNYEKITEQSKED